jgi:putative ABC transport system substrate-binding protein
MLVNPSNPTHAGGKPRWKSLADSIGLPIESVSASTESDFEPAIASLAKMQVDALNVIPDTLFGSYRENLVAVLARHGMPAMFPTRESVVAGGANKLWRQLRKCASSDRQLRWPNSQGREAGGPAGVAADQVRSCHQPKTAKALGLTVPNTVLAQATEVIE